MADSRGKRLFSDLNAAFRKDEDIDEYDIIPVLEPTKNKSPLILTDHKLGFEIWSIKVLFDYAYHRLMSWRSKEGDARYADMEEVGKLSRAVVLINADCYTAWNIRKDLVLADELSLFEDLKLSSLVLRKHPKSPETFSHRRWLLEKLKLKTTCNSKHGNIEHANDDSIDADEINIDIYDNHHCIQNNHIVPSKDDKSFVDIIKRELSICSLAADRYPSNYNAWNHRIWVIKHGMTLKLSVLLSELQSTETWVCSHISDHSGFHYRQFLLMNIAKQAQDYRHFFHKEQQLIQDLIQSYPGHEALWYHRKFILNTLARSCTRRPDIREKVNQKDYSHTNDYTNLKKSRLEDDAELLLLKEIDLVSDSDLKSPNAQQKNLAQKYIDWIKEFLLT